MDTTNRSRVLLIDADCFKYIFAWHHKDKEDVEDLKKDIRIRLDELLTLAGTRSYIGIFGSDCTWRVKAYRFKPYKGNRPPKPEFVQKWGPTIEQYCREELGFMKMPNWEADDVLAYLGALSGMTHTFIICSPDKDLQQIPGWHLTWKDTETHAEGTLHQVSEEAATRKFWMQMLTGDPTDNVAGVPGLGEKKAEAILKEAIEPLEMELAVGEAYRKYFGEFYGPMIMKETEAALKMGPPQMTDELLEIKPLSFIRELEDQSESRILDMFSELQSI